MRWTWLILIPLLAAMPPPASADWTARGTFQYRDRIEDLSGFTGETVARPIRHARVEIVRGSGIIGTGVTDTLGNFEFPVVDSQTGTLFCRVVSVSNLPGLNIRVQASTALNTLYAVAGDQVLSHDPADDVDFGTMIAEPAGGGEAFNIFDVLVDGSDYAATLLGGYPTQSVGAVWSPSSTVGTFFSGGAILLLSDEAWDDAVIAHEHGHFIDLNYSASDNPGGSHFLGDNNQDIRLAYGEGVASYHMAAGRKVNLDPHPTWYIDTTGGSGPGNLNFSYEIEEPSVSAIGAASEVSVQAVLWDMIDGPGDTDDIPGDDDPRSYPIASVWKVMHEYLPLASTISLEDFWNGWFAPGFDFGDLPGMTSVFGGLRIEYFADSFEPDGRPALAPMIPVTGVPQEHTFYPDHDVDMAHFVSPASGTPYVIETVSLLSGANTEIAILDHDSTTVLASNGDRSDQDRSSLILWTAPGAGDYFVKVDRQPDVGTYGSYSLRVIQGKASTVGFSDVASASGVESGRPGRGSAWGDYDNDRRPDLFVTNTAGNSWALYHNEGNGRFTDVAAAAGVTGNGKTGEQCVWGDYDNDGDPDIYVAAIGANMLYRNNGDGTFTDVAAAAGVAYAGNGSLGASWADYDNDGRLDLFVATIGANDILYRNNGDGTFTDATAAAGVGGSGEDTFGGVWADYDGDGDVDLFVHNDTAPNRLYRNNGDGTFTDVTPAVMIQRTVRSWGATWSDYDGDGDFDLFVSTLGSPCRLYRNDGGGAFTDASAAAGVDLSGSQTGNAVADFDYDGDGDIYMGAFEEPNIYLDNITGSAFYRSGKAAVAVQSRSTTVADFDGDGDLDIYVVSGGDGPNVLYSNNGTGNPWIRFRLVGSESNRSAIGATVTLRSGGHRRIQAVSGGSGYIGQNDLALTFGLGGTAGPDSFDVRWPSGTIRRLAGLTRNRVYTIHESDTTMTPPPDPTSELFRLAQNSPNPFGGTTSIAFELPRAGHVTLEIFDVMGRRVTTLLDDNLNAGHYDRTWNGQRDAGGRAAAGLYFYRLSGPAGTVTRKMLFTPSKGP